MKRIKETTLILLMILSVSFGVEYSRAKFLQHAYENSEELAELKEDRIIAENMRKEYNATAFPQIDGAFNYQFKPKSYSPYDINMGNIPAISDNLDESVEGFDNDKIIAGVLDGLTQGLGSFDLSPKKHTMQWEITAMQPIYAQGKVRTGIEIAETYDAMLETQITEKKYTIAEEVNKTYNAALLTEKLIEIQKEALKVAQESHDIAIKRFVAGKGTQLDTLNTRYTVQSEEFKLRTAEKNRKLAIKELTRIVSLEVDPDEVVLTDALTEQDLPISYEEALGRMKNENTILSIFDKNRLFQEKQEEIARADYRPTVAAGAGLGQITQFNEADEIDFGWDIKLFAGVQIPIWHGGQRKYRLAQAQSETRKVEFKKASTENMLTLGLTAAYEDYNLAKEDLLQVEELLALTQKGARIAELSFEIGQITQLELNQAKQNVNNTKLAHANALLTLNNAIVTIEKLTASKSLLKGN